LTARVEALQAEVERLRRGAKRQAAPFPKGTRVVKPKRPGRKPGAGPFRCRNAPPPEAITEPSVDVQVTLKGCPTCGAPLAEERVDFVYRTELPPKPRPKVTQDRVWVCRYSVCGHTVYRIRPRHRHQEVQEVIPADDPRAMVTDRGRRSDAQTFDDVQQHKCLAHIQRSISEVLERKAGRARHVGEGLKRCCKTRCSCGMHITTAWRPTS
jgi:hypothetical protein